MQLVDAGRRAHAAGEERHRVDPRQMFTTDPLWVAAEEMEQAAEK